MKRYKYYIIYLFILIVNIDTIVAINPYSYTFSINVSDISLMRINPSTTINLNLLSTQAGSSTGDNVDNSSYLQLTSIPPNSITRRIMATISSGSIPAGTKLTLYAIKKSGTIGTCGTAQSEKTLSSSSNETIIDAIGSGYTGSLAEQGFQLFYTYKVDNATYAQLRATQSIALIITYTISNNSN
jgi:hypothetical protein